MPAQSKVQQAIDNGYVTRAELLDPTTTHIGLADHLDLDEASVRRWRKANGFEAPVQKSPRVLLFDLETSPVIGYCWGIWQTDIIEVIQDWKLLTVSWTWLGSGEYEVKQLCDIKGYKKGSLDDKKLTEFVWSLLDQADVVSAHNLNGFDDKKINAKFIEHGLGKPSPYTKVDTLAVARKSFKMSSHRLDSMGETLGFGRKEKHSGFQTWKGAMAGDKALWEEMRAYARKDVILLEKLFLRILPWIPNLNLNLYTDADVCSNCGGSSVVEVAGKFTTTKVRRTPMRQCQDCRTWQK